MNLWDIDSRLGRSAWKRGEKEEKKDKSEKWRTRQSGRNLNQVLSNFQWNCYPLFQNSWGKSTVFWERRGQVENSPALKPTGQQRLKDVDEVARSKGLRKG